MAPRPPQHAHVVLASLQSLAASSYGPAGRSKIVQAGGPEAVGGAITLTSISHRLFGALCMEDPFAKVLLQLLAARQERGADGGLLTIMVATGLVRGAADRKLPARFCASLLPAVLSRAVDAVLDGGAAATDDRRSGPPLPSAAVRMRMGDLRCLLAVVRTVLQPKHVAVPDTDTDALHRLALLVVEAFVGSLSDESGADGRAEPQAVDSDAEPGVSPSSAERRAAAVLPGATCRQPHTWLHVVACGCRPVRLPACPPAVLPASRRVAVPMMSSIGLYSPRLGHERASGR